MIRIKDFFKSKKAKKFQKKHKVGLCLSGGGTRGFSYIGAFKAFEEMGIKFDAVAGASIGSLFATLYASGLKSDEIFKYAKNIKDSDFRKSKFGFLPSKMDNLAESLQKVLKVKRIEDFDIPCFVVAVDLKTGREIDFSTGDIISAVTGSCAIPGVYYPVKYRNMNLIDGGTKNNIPVDVLKESGCEYVVTIDCNSTRGGGTNSNNIFTQFTTSISIMMVNNSQKGIKLSDVIIRPKLENFNSLKVAGKDEMIGEGYRATMAVMKDIVAMFKGKFKKRKQKN